MEEGPGRGHEFSQRVGERRGRAGGDGLGLLGQKLTLHSYSPRFMVTMKAKMRTAMGLSSNTLGAIRIVVLDPLDGVADREY